MSRSVASRGTSVPQATNSVPAASNGCVVCARHASTTDGAARSATSRIAPGPLSTAIAPRTTSLSSRTTTRTYGLAFLASSAISNLSRRLPGADHGERAADFGVGELGGNTGVGEVSGGELDNTCAGVEQLLDNRRRQRIVTADDDVALKRNIELVEIDEVLVEVVEVTISTTRPWLYHVHHKHLLLLRLTSPLGDRFSPHGAPRKV